MLNYLLAEHKKEITCEESARACLLLLGNQFDANNGQPEKEKDHWPTLLKFMHAATYDLQNCILHQACEDEERNFEESYRALVRHCESFLMPIVEKATNTRELFAALPHATNHASSSQRLPIPLTLKCKCPSEEEMKESLFEDAFYAPPACKCYVTQNRYLRCFTENFRTEWYKKFKQLLDTPK